MKNYRMVREEKYYVEVTKNEISVKKLYDFCVTEGTGAVDIFVGTVRNHFDGKKVESIDYHGYPEMAEKVLQKIVNQTFEQWPINRVAIQHRLGLLQIKEPSVIIVVSSAHRAEAFSACRYLIEEIKKDLPVWKKENFRDGQTSWKSDELIA
ncbi:molybdenum cofactor biosynthesis protein MoaE [bacterium]|nr:molybdenum cofactor biosynthesis protein MoaE [bacterium]